MQTELHPYHQEPELKAFLKENGIVPQAWYPLGHGDKALLEEPLFAELGKKYGKSAPQIILRWHIQSGNIVIPGSKNPDHIKSNFDLFDFAMTDEEMAQIAALNTQCALLHQHPRNAQKVCGNGSAGRRAEVKEAFPMKKFQKFGSLLLTVLMILSLAACGSKASNDTPAQTPSNGTPTENTPAETPDDAATGDADIGQILQNLSDAAIQ